jgi:tetratricopeptide (TPR) repeat protein
MDMVFPDDKDSLPPAAVRSRSASGASPPEHQANHRGHRRRRHHRPHGQPRGPEDWYARAVRALWIILALVVAVYLVFLFRSLGRRSASPRAATPKTAAAPAKPESGPAADTTRLIEQEAEDIENRIQRWQNAIAAAENANDLMQRKNLVRAEERLQEALQAGPASIALQLASTRVCIELGKYEEAKTLLLSVLDAEPANGSARLALAGILATQQNHPAALAVAKWTLQADPYSTEAHQIIANAYVHLDRHSMALPHLRRLASMDPDNAMAQNNLAVVYTQVGQFDKAEQIYHDLIRKEPANSVTHFNLAVCYVRQSKHDAAVDTLARASALFGSAFVQAWMKGPDFDPMRSHPEFLALADRLESGGGPAPVNGERTIARLPPPEEPDDSGLAPAP